MDDGAGGDEDRVAAQPQHHGSKDLRQEFLELRFVYRLPVVGVIRHLERLVHDGIHLSQVMSKTIKILFNYCNITVSSSSENDVPAKTIYYSITST